LFVSGEAKDVPVRQAFLMRLKAGCAVEYRKRHDEIWPELSAALRAAGISDYSIFLDEPSLTLFAVCKVADEAAAAGLPKLSVVRRWWDAMAPLMEVNPDNSPKQWPLREVFHHD
jgi:L-rhamnose mutarotase